MDPTGPEGPREQPEHPTQGGAPASGHSVTLVKGAHRWAFVCGPGEEGELLRAVRDVSRRGDTAFDQFDAALVAHQIARRLRPGLNRRPGTADGPST